MPHADKKEKKNGHVVEKVVVTASKKVGEKVGEKIGEKVGGRVGRVVGNQFGVEKIGEKVGEYVGKHVGEHVGKVTAKKVVKRAISTKEDEDEQDCTEQSNVHESQQPDVIIHQHPGTIIVQQHYVGSQQQSGAIISYQQPDMTAAYQQQFFNRQQSVTVAPDSYHQDGGSYPTTGGVFYPPPSLSSNHNDGYPTTESYNGNSFGDNGPRGGWSKGSIGDWSRSSGEFGGPGPVEDDWKSDARAGNARGNRVSFAMADSYNQDESIYQTSGGGSYPPPSSRSSYSHSSKRVESGWDSGALSGNTRIKPDRYDQARRRHRTPGGGHHKNDDEQYLSTSSYDHDYAGVYPTSGSHNGNSFGSKGPSGGLRNGSSAMNGSSGGGPGLRRTY